MQIFKLMIIVALVASCSHKHKTADHLTKDSQTLLKANLEFLASDELEGREATKRGAHIASQYIASQLKQYGVKPLGDDGTYFQNFELQSTQYLPDSKINIDLDGNSKALSFGDNFVAFNSGKISENSEIVYLGFGVTDTASNYDDYAGIDVSGKTVVCISGVPDGDEDFKKRMGQGRWSRSTTKANWAKEKGAAGIFVFTGPFWIKRWSRLANYSMGERIGKVIEENDNGINAAWLDSSLVKEIVNLKNLTYSQLFDTLESGFIKLGTSLGTAAWEIIKESKIVKARNVVGIIDGSDKSLENELVTLGAHYDHEGIKGGKVYNGADDNGSGTVAILESARQIAAAKSNKRPVVYVFHTAEEKGLLGAYNFADNFERFDDVIVNINLDMVGREHEDSLYVVGSGKLSSEFFDIVENANKETSNFVFDYTYDDEGHRARIYYRSDHWAFAKKGVPVVFLTDMHATDYHKPTDDVEKINFKKLERVTRLANQIALKVANLDHKLIVDNANISGVNKKNKEQSSSAH